MRSEAHPPSSWSPVEQRFGPGMEKLGKYCFGACQTWRPKDQFDQSKNGEWKRCVSRMPKCFACANERRRLPPATATPSKAALMLSEELRVDDAPPAPSTVSPRRHFPLPQPQPPACAEERPHAYTLLRAFKIISHVDAEMDLHAVSPNGTSYLLRGLFSQKGLHDPEGVQLERWVPEVDLISTFETSHTTVKASILAACVDYAQRARHLEQRIRKLDSSCSTGGAAGEATQFSFFGY